jgi:hypothetical protein
VIFGAGSIVRDAHLPAYAAVATRSPASTIRTVPGRGLAAQHGTRALSLEEALAVEGAVFDLATPPSAHEGLLRALPKGSVALVQNPWAWTCPPLLHPRSLPGRRLVAAVNFQLRFAP